MLTFLMLGPGPGPEAWSSSSSSPCKARLRLGASCGVQHIQVSAYIGMSGANKPRTWTFLNGTCVHPIPYDVFICMNDHIVGLIIISNREYSEVHHCQYSNLLYWQWWTPLHCRLLLAIEYSGVPDRTRRHGRFRYIKSISLVTLQFVRWLALKPYPAEVHPAGIQYPVY